MPQAPSSREREGGGREVAFVLQSWGQVERGAPGPAHAHAVVTGVAEGDVQNANLGLWLSGDRSGWPKKTSLLAVDFFRG